MGPDFLDSPDAIYRSLIEASDNFVFALDSEGKFIFANTKAIETFGNLIGKSFTIPIPSEYHDVVKENFERRVRGEKVEPYRIEVIDKEGNRLWVEVSGSQLQIDGKTLGLVYFLRDITERKKTEEALQETLKRYRVLFNSANDIVLVHGLTEEGFPDKFTDVNDEACNRLGYTREELFNLSPTDIVPPRRVGNTPAVMKKIFTDKHVLFESYIVTKDGREIPVEINAHLFNIGGQPTILSIARDITERKKAEESMKWQLMKFRIEKGNSYLVKETKPNVSLDVYLDLINCGFSGTILSRRRSEDIKEVFGEETEVFWIAEKTGEKIIAPDLEEIESLIEKLPQGDNVVFLDRLDYLIVKNGFENTLRFIQKLNELFYLKKWVLLIALDTNTLGKRELGLLENETNPVKPSHSLDLDEDIYEILKYVYKEEKEGRKPAYRDVGLECGITKQTTRKRIEILKGEGYLIDKKKGRYKILELTEKGKYLF